MEVNYDTLVDMQPINNTSIRIQVKELGLEEFNIPIYIEGTEICDSNIVGYVRHLSIDWTENRMDRCGVKELDTIQSKAIFSNQKFLSKLELVPIYVCVGDKFREFLYFQLRKKVR